MRVLSWPAMVVSVLSIVGLAKALTAQENAGATLVAEAVKYLPEESIGTVTLWPARTVKLPAEFMVIGSWLQAAVFQLHVAFAAMEVPAVSVAPVVMVAV